MPEQRQSLCVATLCLSVAVMSQTAMVASAENVTIDRAPFGQTWKGEKVEQFTLRNTDGVEVKLITYGATVTSLKLPDRNGKLEDVVLGYDNIEEFENDVIYSGCIVGRFANRISNGKFTLEGNEYPLVKNFPGGHHLHGGTVGFNSRVWKARRRSTSEGVGVRFRLTSADGEEGYPGKLNVLVTYTLNEQNELIIDYNANTTKTTHLNLTQHSYFNLAGHDSGNVFDHRIQLNCDHYLPVDEHGVPTGEIAAVDGTPFDFRKERTIGSRIKEQPMIYDHNYVLSMKRPSKVLPLARVVEPKSGRVMEVLTDQPGVQFYTSIHMTEVNGRGGSVYKKYQAFCLETQHFPDTPNKPNFPSTILRPDETFKSRTIHRFSVQK